MWLKQPKKGNNSTSGSKFYKSKFAMVWVVAIRFDFLSSPLYDFREINPHIMRAHYTSTQQLE